MIARFIRDSSSLIFNMNAFFCAVIFGISSLVSSSQASAHVFEKLPSRDYDVTTITLERGQKATFVCGFRPTKKCEWLKDTVKQISPFGNNTCRQFDYHTRNYSILNESSCYDRNITLIKVHDQHNGTWLCRYGVYDKSKTYVVAVVSPKTTAGPRTEVLSTSGVSKPPRTGDSETNPGTEETTSDQSVQPTGSETASNFLLPVVGAAAGGLLIITLIVIVVAVKRKKSKKGGVETAPPQKNSDPEVELIDADGQYASIEDTARGKTAASVEVPAMEPNPMYESYGGNQSENQNQNQNQNQSLNQNQNQADGGDVYSVVNKPDKSSVQEPAIVVETGGDVYSVVQKKKQDPPATDGVQSTPDQDITDVYSVVQKPGKTSE